MPSIIDYEIVLEHLSGQGLVCNYHNSGAFAFPPQVPAIIRGWIGPADPTIKPRLAPLLRQANAPFEATLASHLGKFWRENLPGRAWVMPMSHWSYELNFGSGNWLPDALREIRIDPKLLEGRNNAAALEFLPGDDHALEPFTQRLLEKLLASDFLIAFPGKAVVCTVHHHKQLWWMTTAEELAEAMDLLLPPTTSGQR